MTISRTQLILLAVAAVILLVVGIVAGRGCTPAPQPTGVVDPGDVDAGPGEEIIAGALDGSVRAGEAHITAIELKFDSDMAAFDEQQRAEYQALRGGDDLDAAAQYLSTWNRARRADAGTP